MPDSVPFHSDFPAADSTRLKSRGTVSTKVQKFGGTSVGSVEGMRSVVRIVRKASASHRIIVVVSALQGVTDRLVRGARPNGTGTSQVHMLIEELWTQHHVLASGLLQQSALQEYEAILQKRLEKLIGLLSRLHREHNRYDALNDAVLAIGERLSAPLTALALRSEGLDAVVQDAAEIISTDSTHGQAHVDLKETAQRIRDWESGLRPTVVPVVTGFIGADARGTVTTLGRGGSDYSAALLASGVGAFVLERWTDVDGLYTDDPRTNDDARQLSHIVLDEALAWNQAGRLGMHRKALDPLVAAQIPTHVRCTTTPERKGTIILPSGQETETTIRTLAS